jgi:hypothetical protein
VKRSRRGRSRAEPTAGRGPRPWAAAPPPTTPVAAADLHAEASTLRPLLAELAELAGSGPTWNLRVLRRNVEIALLSPETLRSAENQLDFIEELAEAVWDPSDPGLRAGATAAPGAPEARRRAILGHLDRLADRLCREAEEWQRRRAAAAGDGRPETAGPGDNPQSDHRL